MRRSLMGGIFLLLCSCLAATELFLDTGPVKAILVPKAAFTEDGLRHLLHEYGQDVPSPATELLFFLTMADAHQFMGGKPTEAQFPDWKKSLEGSRPFPMAQVLRLGEYVVLRWRDLGLELHNVVVSSPDPKIDPLVFQTDHTRAEIVHVDLRETPIEAFKTNLYLRSDAPLTIDYAKKLLALVGERFHLNQFAIILRNDTLFLAHVGYPAFNDLLPPPTGISAENYAASTTVLCTKDDSGVSCSKTSR